IGAARERGAQGAQPVAGERRRTKVLALWSSDGTDTHLSVTGVLALALTGALYAGPLALVDDVYLGALFYDRGTIPYVTTWFAMWAFAMVGLKALNLRSQRRGLRSVRLGDREGPIRPEDCAELRRSLYALDVDPQRTFLLRRLLVGLRHFESRRDEASVRTALDAQRDIDEGAVDSSYTMLRVFLWAIPILGFIGTVLGIGQSVGSFTAAVETVKEVDQIKSSLGGITSGLALAFDTTLLALALSVLLMFPVSMLQRSEEHMLRTVELYCNERFLRRIVVGRRGTTPHEAVTTPSSTAARAGPPIGLASAEVAAEGVAR
ncbi:MAG TPA: MotA/TolQ/ExbB proton channel family protein, partial [Planctomycetota bacterium]|nr:MotA/TolQ/ExbB proton channel family protein [Planctomycetota bacterium]